jgi:hypothetical protein
LPAALATTRGLLARESNRLFQGADTIDATMALGAWSLRAARTAGLADVRVEAAPTVPTPGGLMGVQIDLRGSCDTKALTAWLAVITRGPRLVTVERLDIAASGEGALTVSARLRGFAQAGAQ